MSRFEVDLQLEVVVEQEAAGAVLRAAEETLIHEQASPPGAMTILLTSDERVQVLNRDFMDVDAPTDVLSFPFGEAPPGMPEYLGDVAISVPAAKRQAEAGGHSLTGELQLLTVHAVLHLLGYDHAEPAETSRMWETQRIILERLGAEAAVVPTGE